MTDETRRDQRPEPVTEGGSRGAASGGTKMPLETLVRNLAAVTAIFYITGFLTTNAYLYRLGVSDFSLLRTRFVLTGVLTLTPLILALVWGIYAAVDAEVFAREGGLTRRGYLFVLGDVAIPFVLYFALFAYLAENEVVAAARDAALLSLLCAVVVLALLGALVVYRVSDRRPVSRFVYRHQPVSYERFSRRFGVPDALVETMILAVAATLLLLTYVGLFGHYFYPAIPAQIGGGRPRPTQLLIAGDAIPAARELRIAVSEDAPLAPPVELLWEGEESYVICLPSPHERAVVQLSRGLVDGLVTGEVLRPATLDDESP